MTAWQIALAVILPLGAIIGAIALLYFVALPRTLVKKIRGGEDGVKYPPDYEELKRAVTVERDKSYASAFGDYAYDVYRSQSISGRSPYVLWIHGGFFVAGDKRGTENLCTFLAANGVTVVSANYALAPEHKHPTAVKQVDEILNHIKNNEPTLDSERVILAGDSAGGNITAEYAALLTNEELRQAAGIKPSFKRAAVKAVALICAPIDVGLLAGVNDKLDKLLPIFGRAYYGAGKWHKKPRFAYTKTLDYITRDFPPAFITDGNHISFESQNRALADKLKGLGVKTEELFFEGEQVEHEYIFDMEKGYAIAAANKLIAFIKDAFKE